jgi:hypothetical protein
MPTVILLDNSLSMYKKWNIQSVLNHRDAAHAIIRGFLNSLTKKDNFEYVSLVSPC